jgi:hypothetical protein
MSSVRASSSTSVNRCAIPLIVRVLARRRGDVVEVTVGAGK